MSGNNSVRLSVERVVIVGTGLLGASLGLGLRARGFAGRRIGVGRRLETARRAAELGCVDEGTTDLQAALAENTLVVLATPISAFAEILGQIGAAQVGRMIVTDVGSTKQYVCAEARRLLGGGARFVGSHPMAGSERHGPDAAVVDLFADKPCVVTPERDTDATTLSLVRELWRMLGMKVIEMTPAAHDEQVALISHLPHAVACMLVNLAQAGGALGVASTGFRDTTRVASGDPTVWRDIFATNRAAVAEALGSMRDEMDNFRRLLDGNDDARLLAWLSEAKRGRDDWAKSATLTGENDA